MTEVELTPGGKVKAVDDEGFLRIYLKEHCPNLHKIVAFFAPSVGGPAMHELTQLVMRPAEQLNAIVFSDARVDGKLEKLRQEWPELADWIEEQAARL